MAPYIKRSAIWPDPRVKPPAGAVEIDWSHPLTRGLVSCFLLNEGGGRPVDIATNRLATIQGTPQGYALGVNGSYFKANALAHFEAASDVGTFDVTSQDFSVVFDVYPVSGDSGGAYVGRGSTSDDGWQITYGGSASLTFFTSQTGANQGTAILSVTLGILNRLVVARSGSVIHAYHDGIEMSYGDPGNHLDPQTNTRAFSVGKSASSGRIADGVDRVLFYNGRELSLSDAQWLYAEPYCFLRPLVRRRYWAPRKFVLMR